mgnify:CR=1 FL=1
MGNQKGKLSLSIGDGILPDLPLELWEVILMNTEAKTLAMAVPQVCKVLNELSCQDRIWKHKFYEEFKPQEAPELKEDMTWKKLYFKGEYLIILRCEDGDC